MRARDATTAFAAVALAALLIAPAARADAPAVLVLSPQGATNGWVDLDYLNELHQSGFEVDYTDSMADVTWDRLRQFNALIVYTCPPEPGQDAWPFLGQQPIYKADVIALLERFLGQGGGIFVMAVETQIRTTLVRDLIRPWGADLPLETIVDAPHTAFMTHMPSVPLAFTDQIATSPVSVGVRGVWYPLLPHYNGGDTLPLAVDNTWQVVVRAMPSARTVPVDLSKSPYPGPPTPLVRPNGVSAPPLFAIRQYAAGRIALMSQWPTYSLGAGTKWLYNREVVSRGLGNQPSDFGRLLQNTLRWLAAPSLQSHTVGGYATVPERLIAPNLRPQAKQQYQDTAWSGMDSSLLAPPRSQTLFKGLIGAQTSLSGGSGSVAEYAAAAKQSGLDFVVFLENFVHLDADKLAQLKADCQRYSDASLTLLPGFWMQNNIGNSMFLFGPNVSLPPTELLTGARKNTFKLQGETAPGVFGVTPPAAMDYLTSLSRDVQIGYYSFARSRRGLRLPDARLYAMAGIRTYRNSVRIDDALPAYLTTAQSTIAPVPVATTLLRTPRALQRAVERGRGLTYAMASSRPRLWSEALHYTDQYSCPNVFPSTGPLIWRWPGCVRVATLGAEPFVTGRSVMAAPIYVTADRGLREVRLYDGEQLYRRFVLKGEPVFSTVLQLEASVQHNLVLVADDMAGGQAVSAARRSWKDGSLAPIFCADRINDCANMLLARGPYPMPVLKAPEIADAGVTWDGGPKGILTPVDFEGSNPELDTPGGMIDGDQYNQTPLLEFADEGATTVRSVRDELIAAPPPWGNPWNTYGPRQRAASMQFWLSYSQFERPSVGVPPTGWAAVPDQAGGNAALFRGHIMFKTGLTVRSLRLLRNWNWIASLPLRLVLGRGASVRQEIDIASVASPERFTVARGDWFGFYAPQTANSQVFVNRGDPVQLQVGRQQNGEWISVWSMHSNAVVSSGQEYAYELFGLGWPLDVAAHDARVFADTLTYLSNPDGLRLTRGQRVNSPGPLEVLPDNYAVHLKVPRPDVRMNMTLPLLVTGLNRRWSTGLWQISGFSKGDYGDGTRRYRALGLDLDGRAYVPLYPDLADQTEIEVGHPVVADARGNDLFIQVTALSGGTQADPQYRWFVDVNNPSDQEVTTVLSQNMALADLQFATRPITLAPGEYRVLLSPQSPTHP